MDISKITKIHNELDKLSMGASNNKLVEFIEKIDEMILDMVRDSVLNLFHKTLNGELIIDGNVYSLMFSPNVHNNFNLVVVLKNTISMHDKKIEKSVKIDGKRWGSYGTVTLIAPHYLWRQHDSILMEIKEVYEICYSWLDAFMHKTINKFETELSEEIYEIFTRTSNSMHKGYLNESVWFVIADGREKKGYHIVGGENKEIVKNIFVNSQSVFSPAQLLLNLYTNTDDFEKIFSKIAIQEKKIMDFNLSNAKYKASRYPFYVSERILAASDDFSMYPLVDEGHYYLLAWYQQRYKKDAEEVLSACSSDLKKAFSTKYSLLKRYLKAIERLNIPYDHLENIARVAGVFLGYLTRPWIR